ncbi:hypothetical protein OG579_16990 [Williamsia herbipolensis]|uniref:Uncharacterized protein n=1 Tax=Williamsia herbipolensis TaxID=1603258 RepID=A0AAU4K076_9NOCA|nr:hypothetical protein [Williamsia herbipolensis]
MTGHPFIALAVMLCLLAAAVPCAAVGGARVQPRLIGAGAAMAAGALVVAAVAL